MGGRGADALVGARSDADALVGRRRADFPVRFPFDFSFAVKRLLKRVQPDAIVLVELETWPIFCRSPSAGRYRWRSSTGGFRTGRFRATG